LKSTGHDQNSFQFMLYPTVISLNEIQKPENAPRQNYKE
jgi:hypothetical protein